MDQEPEIRAAPPRRAGTLFAGAAIGLILGTGLGWTVASERQGLAARVNGEAIRNLELNGELRARFGNDVLQDLVNHVLINQEARKEGVTISEAETQTRLARMKEDPQVQSLLAAGKVTEVDLRRNLSTLMPLDKLAEKRITADQEKEYLLAHREDLETVRTEHILVASDIEANAVLHKLQKGADFAKLAGDCSLDADTRDKGGDLGDLHRSQMEPEIATVLFQTQPGQLTPVVHTEQGWHVFRVESHKFEYKDLQPAVHELLVEQARGEVLEELRRKASVEVFKPYHLAEPSPTPGLLPSPSPEVDKS